MLVYREYANGRFPIAGHFENVPYNDSTVRSAYHTRAYDIFKLSFLSPRNTVTAHTAGSGLIEEGGVDGVETGAKVDIFLSHDWPIGITKFGDERGLLRRKTFFAEEVRLFNWST